jgi:hypothetical protein
MEVSDVQKTRKIPVSSATAHGARASEKLRMPMTIRRVVAARGASAGFHPPRSLVIGSIATAGWNAAGWPRPMAMRRQALSINTNSRRLAPRPASRGCHRVAAA